MGDKTKIDWCDATWNPVTGCLHGCEYCYARGTAKRFGGHLQQDDENDGYVLTKPMYDITPMSQDIARVGRMLPYPYDFAPTFHRYRLDIPAHWTRSRTIFVCSMADLFGEWVPDEWIIEVLEACRKAPQHRYLFLTKNPMRYDQLEDAGIITRDDMNFWLGSTTTDINQDFMHWDNYLNTFLSCEPMLAPWHPAGEPNCRFEGTWPKWVIFGAETGNREGKVIPEKAWIDNAVQMCRNIGAKVFMKESLRKIMGADFQQEFPWEA